MPPKLSWVDFSSKDKDSMLNVVSLYKENDTRDELGISSVRDAISDYFFPGTSTIQTRAKYFLFVSWIYLSLEKKNVKSSEMEQRARKFEIDLIYSLIDQGEKKGVIGIDARDTLKRLPSNVYWNGLKTWGIRLFPGNQSQYFRSIDEYRWKKQKILKAVGEYRWKKQKILKAEGEESLFSKINSNWHPGLPQIPDGFPNNVNLLLSKDEAEYLRERILTSHGNSLMAHFVNKINLVKSDFLWDEVNISDLPASLRKHLSMARSFAEVINGAALVYNLMLSELKDNTDRIDEYNLKLSKWKDIVESRSSEITEWAQNLNSFWSSAMLQSARIPKLTKRFIEDWVKLVVIKNGYKEFNNNNSIQNDIRNLIEYREKQLKGARSRIKNQRALELWAGAAGTGMLDYRWGVSKVILTDIINGLKG